MAEQLEADLVLNTDDAQRAVTGLGGDIEDALKQSADTFSTAMEQAVSGVPDVVITPDTSEVDPAIRGALDDADTALPITPETDTIVPDIEESLAGVAATVPVDADTEMLAGGITDAVTAMPPPDVPLRIDDTNLQSEIASAVEGAPEVDVPLSIDSADAESSLSDLDAAGKGASESIDGVKTSTIAASGAASLATGSWAEFAAGLTEVEGKTGLVAASAVAGAAAMGIFAEAGVQAKGAAQQFDASLGNMAERLKSLQDIPGLNVNLEQMRKMLGGDSTALEETTAKLYSTATGAGVAKDRAVVFVEQLVAMAGRAVAVNPTLGDMSGVTERLSNAFARGGKPAQLLGFELTSQEIKARALTDTHKHLASELTFQERAMAGAEIATERYGTGLNDVLAKGADNAITKQRALTTEIKENIAELGKPLAMPLLELLKELVPIAKDAGEVLVQLARGAIPLLHVAVQALAPLLKTLADIFDSMPTPVLTALAALIGIRAAFGPFSGLLQSMSSGLRDFRTNMVLGGEAGATLAAPLTPLANGLQRVAGFLQENSGHLTTIALGALAAASSFDQMGKSVEGTITGISGFTAAGEGIGALFGNPAIGAGIGALVGGVVSLAQAMDDSGPSASEYEATMRKLADSLEKLTPTESFKKFTDALGEQDKAAAALDHTVKVGNQTYYDMRRVVGEVDKQTQVWTQHTEDARPKASALVDEIRNIAKVSPTAARGLVDQLEAAQRFGGGLVYTTDQQQKFESALSTGTGTFQKHAVAADDARKKDEALAAQAIKNAEAQDAQNNSLYAFLALIKDAQDLTDEYVKAVDAGMPTVADAFKNAANVAEFLHTAIDPTIFQRSLDKTVATAESFSGDIATIAQSGFTALAANIAAQGPETGGKLAASIAAGIHDNPEVGNQVAQQMQDSILRIQAFKVVLHDAMSQTWSGSSNAIRDAMFAQEDEIAQGMQMHYITLANGGRKLISQSDYDALLTYLAWVNAQNTADIPGHTKKTMDDTGTALDQGGTTNAGKAHDAGKKQGEAHGTGQAEGTRSKKGDTQAAADDNVPKDQTQAAAQGQAIGHRFGAEVATGIREQRGAVHEAAQSVIPTGGLGAEDWGHTIGTRYGDYLGRGIRDMDGPIHDAGRSVIPTGGLGAEDWGFTIGQRFGRALGDGITDEEPYIRRAAAHAVQEAINAAINAGSHSPAEHDFLLLGLGMGTALAEGLRAMVPTIASAGHAAGRAALGGVALPSYAGVAPYGAQVASSMSTNSYDYSVHTMVDARGQSDPTMISIEMARRQRAELSARSG